jgi:pimeloyl-ACP methyl ester carboxylesterase
MWRSYQPTRRGIIGALAGFGAVGGRGLGRSDALAGEVKAGSAQRVETAAGAGKAKWSTLPPTPTLPPAMRSGVATVNGTSVFYAQFGQGPPVLLLHGGLANSDYWGHQVRHLASSFSVVVADTRGHGRSPVMGPSFSYGVFAEDAAALLDFLKIPQAAIVGWSDGAVTGLQLAMTRPEKVSKLFVFGANSSADGLKANGARSPVFVTFAARCRTEYAVLSPHPERWPQLLDGLRHMWRTEPNFTARNLAAVKAATTVSDGEHDEIIKREHTERMARSIPHARLMMLAGVSHFAMLQDPHQFNQALGAFLE